MAKPKTPPKRDPNRCPTHPGAVLREIVLPESIVRGDWPKAVAQLLAEPRKRRELHEKGPRHVAAHFDALALAKDALALLHTVSTCRRCSI